MENRVEELKEYYMLIKHVEGGSFSEVYTAPFEKDGRPLAGSIYFLLEKDELSHLHEIDCDEIWYYHEGVGMKITVLYNNEVFEYLLGKNIYKGEKAMVLIKAGSIFGAENLSDGYTFVSCATTPNFTYEGFRLVSKEEIKEKYPDIADKILYLGN